MFDSNIMGKADKSYKKLNKYLDIQEHNIYAKYNLQIIIDSEDFKISEDMIDIAEDDASEDIQGVLNMPCMFDIEVPEENDEVQLYLAMNVNLIVPDNVSKQGSISTYTYQKGDRICYASTKTNATNISTIDKLFENRVKYLRGDMPKLVTAIYEQFKSTKNIKMHHIEAIVSMLYGEYTDDGFVPVRLLKNQKYTKDNALTTKDSSHKLKEAAGFNYGYSKNVIVDNISRTYSNGLTDIEKIIAGKFDEI